jgi:hypothetical protein
MTTSRNATLTSTRSPFKYGLTTLCKRETHVNRLYETATWWPDSRWMINTTQQRYNSSAVDLYALGDADMVTGPFDLLKITEAAARAQLKKRIKDDSNYEFSLDSTISRSTTAASCAPRPRCGCPRPTPSRTTT